ALPISFWWSSPLEPRPRYEGTRGRLVGVPQVRDMRGAHAFTPRAGRLTLRLANAPHTSKSAHSATDDDSVLPIEQPEFLGFFAAGACAGFSWLGPFGVDPWLRFFGCTSEEDVGLKEGAAPGWTAATGTRFASSASPSTWMAFRTSRSDRVVQSIEKSCKGAGSRVRARGP